MSVNRTNFLSDENLRNFIAKTFRLDYFEGSLTPFNNYLDEKIVSGLEKTGIKGLYEHQRLSLDLATSGKNFVIATPTASGKSLCYLLPILTKLSRDAESKALLLFPTKALSRDQEKGIATLLNETGFDSKVMTVDGDTPQRLRTIARRSASILITNPDMLHSSILPGHTFWANFFSSLRTIVIDEIHQYRGVFGSHVANVIRRLKRILSFYGSKPLWIASSATIANPLDIASNLIGEEFVSITTSSAPISAKSIFIATSPIIDFSTGRKLSHLSITSDFAFHLIQSGLQSIVFCNSRNAVEVVLKLIREKLKTKNYDSNLVKSYRSGYLPSIRRQIEKELKDGRLRCIVATSALELGIDIGGLDAAVMAGYPGTIASLHQRIGRVGRRGNEGIVILVLGSNPLEQYLLKHPSFLFGSSPESCHINPDNLEILLPHLKCATSEIPLQIGENFGGLDSDDVSMVMEFLKEKGEVATIGKKYHLISNRHPWREVSLRTAGTFRMIVVDEEGKVIEEIEKSRVLRTLHPNAILQSMGGQYEVIQIDFEKGKIFTKEVNCDYYTEPLVKGQIHIIEERDSREVGAGKIFSGDVKIVQEIVGWKCIKYDTNEVISAGQTLCPSQEIETNAIWLRIGTEFFDKEKDKNNIKGFEEAGKSAISALRDGLEGVAHLFKNIGALGVMCDPKDIGHSISCNIEEDSSVKIGIGMLFIYEQYEGGVGIVNQMFGSFEKIILACIEVVKECGCKYGCPSCVGPPENREDSRKISSISILSNLIPAEKAKE